MVLRRDGSRVNPATAERRRNDRLRNRFIFGRFRMTYKIEEIEGIGPVYGERLRTAGILTTDELLERGHNPKGRKELAAQTGISEAQLLKWLNLADLMRITGIGPQYSELLEAAGVDTVKELKHRNAENLAAKMKEVKEQKKLTRAVPSVKQVTEWIEQAESLEPKLKY
jgi:predicted flap endonuclease-1-like 5' DNA nuclease